jgi:hypothetical protein
MPEAAPDFADAVERVHARLAAGETTPMSPVFPLEQGVEMYRYLYRDQPLFYEGDRAYLAESDSGRQP